jgi:hypothetical protein
VSEAGDWIDNSNRQDNLPGKGHVRFPGTIGFAYDATRGRLIMLDQNAIADSSSISAHISDDFGDTWSSSIWVSVWPSGGPVRGDQFFPAVGVDSVGDYVAIWQDTRNDAGDHRIETFQGCRRTGADLEQPAHQRRVLRSPPVVLLLWVLHRRLQPDRGVRRSDLSHVDGRPGTRLDGPWAIRTSSGTWRSAADLLRRRAGATASRRMGPCWARPRWRGCLAGSVPAA